MSATLSQRAKRAGRLPGRKTWLGVAALLLLSGCATVDPDALIARSNAQAGAFTQGQLSLARTAEQRAARKRLAQDLLRQPLGQHEAVQLALVNSPALQALLARQWAQAAQAAQAGRIANPVFTFERLRSGDELELGRLLSFGLLDLLTLPQRHRVAQEQLAQQQLRQTSEVVDQVTQVRQAWVKAVAAQQSLVYAQQVNDAAQASSELARRLQAAGNFSKLARARQQLFYADAATQWAAAQHSATAAREALVRLLGLNDAQAAQLTLPERLPDLPTQPRAPEAVSQQASQGRLDLQLAQAQWQAAARAQGLNTLTSLTDIELGVRRDTTFDNAAGTASTRRGFEVSLRLPLFDAGELQRQAMNAGTLAAANQLEATLRAAGSTLRESYSAYRTAYDVSRHYRDEVVPLRQLISEENVLRYNGMLIGVFELLADARDQMNSVLGAITAQQQFWLADAALQAEVIGRPSMSAPGVMPAGSAGAGEGAGH
jgi:outer membrane protein TolC